MYGQEKKGPGKKKKKKTDKDLDIASKIPPAYPTVDVCIMSLT